ncbi:hypothetical protein Tco_1066428 [Tanacetum coccineum]|uniref:Uncharacterized protein n=1 Tax=Tanacetum coccineum TaxID=301880 RepID=A0ABQ5HA04_9ASTR
MEQILQEEASLAEAIRLDSLQREEEAEQIHLDALLAQRIAEEEELTEQQKKRKAQNQGSWKLNQLRKLSFEEVKEEFDKLIKQIDSFAPIRLKEDKDDEAKDDEPTKKLTKRRKQIARKGMHTSMDENVSDDSDKVDEQEETNTGTETPLNLVPVAMKTPSVATYKISKKEDDLIELYRIVMNRYGLDGPEDKLEKGFWKCLRIMFDMNSTGTDSIWSEIEQQKIVSWRYYDTCRVHCLNLESMDVYLLSDRKYPLPFEVCKTMLKMKLLDGKMNEDCYRLFLKMMGKNKQH